MNTIFRKIVEGFKIFFSKKDHYNHVIIMVDGGFCSVLLKYALGLGVKKNLGLDVKYDLTWFEKYGKDCDNKFDRKFQLLELFPTLDYKIASKREIKIFKKRYYYNNKYPYKFDSSLYKINEPRYIDGYYENWQYLKEVRSELIEKIDFNNLELNQKNLEYLADIESSQSIAIHIRRGDYVNLGMSILEVDYYLNAIRFIQNKLGNAKPKLFLFSNDLDWVKTELVPKIANDLNSIIVDVNDNNQGYLDLFLISKCKHQISSNSSFGFWGGYLNQNPEKIVIIPNKWLPVEDEYTIGSTLAHNYPGFYILSYDGR